MNQACPTVSLLAIMYAPHLSGWQLKDMWIGTYGTGIDKYNIKPAFSPTTGYD
jgi:hypothetical protein